MTEIQTARLLLRPWQPDDLAEFTRLLTDPVVTRYIVVSTPFSPEDVAEVHARTLEQWEHNGFGPWVAIEKATGHWVGRIGLDELPHWPGPDKVEVGWKLHREFWGRGLATEGGRAGVRYGFETVGLERIISATMATNAASRRVMEKCGLRFQGELPMAGTVVAWYAIDRADWQDADQRSSPQRQAHPPSTRHPSCAGTVAATVALQHDGAAPPPHRPLASWVAIGNGSPVEQGFCEDTARLRRTRSP